MSRISIVVPVYYNSDTLELLYEDMKKNILGRLGDYEIVFVDDGSKDESWDIMNRIAAADPNVRCVKLSRNFGEHAALLAGLSQCSGDCAVTKQADLQEDSSIILEMYERWKNGNKVVLAVRSDRDEPFFKKLFASIYYMIIHKVVNENMPVGGCDCYLIDRQVIKVLELLDEKNSSLTLQVLWAGFKTDHVYFHRRDREIGRSRWTLSKKVKLAMDSMLSFSYAPIRLMSTLGGIFFIISVIMIIGVVYETIVAKNPQGWASLMCLVLFSSGIIMTMLGIIGEYVWRSLDAARNRPPFVIDEVRGKEDKPL